MSNQLELAGDAKHTPGEWSTCSNTPSLIQNSDGIIIGQTSESFGVTKLGLEEMWANARLFAAAPNLLEAAKASGQCIVDFLELYKNGCSMLVLDEAVKSLKNDALKSVRAAIAKAQGDAS